MSIFKSTTAPYLLALIVSALGWYVGQIDREIRSARSAVFTVERGENEQSITVTIENVSRTQALEDFQFAVVCKNGSIVASREHNVGQLVLRPPVQPIRQAVQHHPGQVTVDASLAPGGSIGLSTHLKDCSSSAEFYYKPKGSSQLYMLNSNSTTGFVVKNYNKILVVSFILFLLTFIGWLAGTAYHNFRRQSDEDTVRDPIYHVRLAVVGAGGCADEPSRPGGQDKGNGEGEGGRNRGPGDCGSGR